MTEEERNKAVKTGTQISMLLALELPFLLISGAAWLIWHGKLLLFVVSVNAIIFALTFGLLRLWWYLAKTMIKQGAKHDSVD